MECTFSIVFEDGVRKVVMGDLPPEIVEFCFNENEYMHDLEEGRVLAAMMSLFSSYLEDQTRKARKAKRHRFN